MVWEDDGELFADVWGDEWTTITDFLNQIHKVSESIKIEIESLARPTSGVAKDLRYKKMKVSYISWKQEPLDADFDSLDSLIPQVEALSCTKFKNRHPERAHHVSSTDAIIHEVGNAFQLIRLANATQPVSQALHRPCLDAQERLNMIMELNFFGVDVANSRTTDIENSWTEDIAISRSKAISVSKLESYILLFQQARDRIRREGRDSKTTCRLLRTIVNDQCLIP